MSVRSFRVEQVLKKLGSDIRDARKRRGITVQLMAERMGVTRVTVAKIERGEPNTSMGNYAMALYILLIRKILQLAEANVLGEARCWLQRRVDVEEAFQDGSVG